jgi:uncharacterized protein (DUF305 family)
MKAKSRKVLAAALALSGVTSLTQMSSAGAQNAMPGMSMHADAGQGASSASTAAFQAADHAMMSGMSSVQYTGDADRDFVAHMIPHHAGAVEMAKVELKYGKDAKLRMLASDIIAAQEKEIAFMKQWLAAHPQHH